MSCYCIGTPQLYLVAEQGSMPHISKQTRFSDEGQTRPGLLERNSLLPPACVCPSSGPLLSSVPIAAQWRIGWIYLLVLYDEQRTVEAVSKTKLCGCNNSTVTLQWCTHNHHHLFLPPSIDPARQPTPLTASSSD